MQKLAVVYFPKINLDIINTFRKKYDANWSVIPPHITIISPISNIVEVKLIEHVEVITKDIKSFPIHLNGLVKSFDDYLFLSVTEGSEKIVNLHDKLYSGILAPYRPADSIFFPHITLGFFKTKDDNFDAQLYTKAFTEAIEMNFDITCDFDTISLIKGDGRESAGIVKTITLLN